MKKQLSVLVLLFLLTAALAAPIPAHADPAGEVFVLVDGLPVDFDVKPVIIEGRTLVPFRALAEALGAAVYWDGQTRTVSAEKGTVHLSMQIAGSTARIGDKDLPMDVPPVLIGGRTLIPARIFSEAFGCRVIWDPAARRVLILSPSTPMTVTGFYALGDSKTSSWTNLFGKPYPGAGPGNTGLVSRLALGWYSLDSGGKLLTASRTGWQRPESWEGVLKLAGEYRMKTEMVVHLTDGDGTITRLLESRPAMERAVSEIVKESRLYNGVNLDFEGLGWGEDGEKLTFTRDSFNRFVRLLSAGLKAAGTDLTLTLHPPNSAYRGYDYQALGEMADHIIVMAYDYGPVPEPVNMVTGAIARALESVPAHKLVLGISVPGETPESIYAKIAVARKHSLAGIAIWRLGLLSDAMWNSIKSSVQAIK